MLVRSTVQSIVAYHSRLRQSCYHIRVLYSAEVGKAQLEAQSATSTTSAIAEVALRFNFLF